MDAFTDTAGAVGSWFDSIGKITGQYFNYKTATEAPAGLRWMPYGSAGQQYAIGANGEMIIRGQPGAVVSPVSSLLPMLLIGAVVVFAIAKLK